MPMPVPTRPIRGMLRADMLRLSGDQATMPMPTVTAKMPWARPASAGFRFRVCEMKGITAANAYQSPARNISQTKASVSIHFCQVLMRAWSASERVLKFMVGPFCHWLKFGKNSARRERSSRRRQEIDLVFGGDANDLYRIRNIADA